MGFCPSEEADDNGGEDTDDGCDDITKNPHYQSPPCDFSSSECCSKGGVTTAWGQVVLRRVPLNIFRHGESRERASLLEKRIDDYGDGDNKVSKSDE